MCSLSEQALRSWLLSTSHVSLPALRWHGAMPLHVGGAPAWRGSGAAIRCTTSMASTRVPCSKLGRVSCTRPGLMQAPAACCSRTTPAKARGRLPSTLGSPLSTKSTVGGQLQPHGARHGEVWGEWDAPGGRCCRFPLRPSVLRATTRMGHEVASANPRNWRCVSEIQAGRP
jgi:hypothetical protein